jgi:protein-S-isoprenylcysteine O-methyltransferase Ste14
VSNLFADVATATCWGVVVLTWAAAALYNVRHAPRERNRTRLGQTWLVVVAAVCAAVALVMRRYWQDLVVEASWVRFLGFIVLAVSTVFTVWARISLGTMWSLGSEVKGHHELRTGGAYAVTRHPIYTGLLGMLLGTTLLNGVRQWIVLFPAGLILLTFKARQEERLLLRTFPGKYERYREQVPQLVPGLSALRRAFRGLAGRRPAIRQR